MADDATKTDLMTIACPTDGALNRVPKSRLGQAPKCGKCHNPLFLGAPLDLTAATFDRHVVRSDLPIIVDFWASWCGPCQTMAPNFAAAARELEPKARLGKLDTEAHQAIAGRYGIRSIPCLIAFSRGREIGRLTGAHPAAAIVQWVLETVDSGS